MRASLIFLILLCCLSLGARDFAWKVAASTDYFVIYSVDGTFPGGKAFVDELEERVGMLQMDLGVYPRSKAEIRIVPDKARYQSLAKGRGAIVEFSEAFYSTRERRIYVRSIDQIPRNYGGLILHEYTHWFLDELLDKAPLWLHEGMATQSGGQMGLERYYYYVRERFWGNRLDLFELGHSYPQQQENWELYYVTSYFAVRYMREKDPRAWKQFWGIVAANNRRGQKTDFNRAFEKAYGLNLYTFNQDFAAASKRQAWIYLITGFTSMLFAILPFLVIVARIRQKKKMKRLPDLELPVQPELETTEDKLEGQEENKEKNMSTNKEVMQTSSRILMVRPAKFEFNVETGVNNQFQQQGKQNGVHQKAVEEFDAFVKLLQDNDVEVIVMQDTQEPHTPDSVFPNNWFSSHNTGELVLYPMFAENRRAERKPEVLDLLHNKLKHNKVIDLTHWEEKNEFLEGTGSMIFDRERRIAYACRSQRTSDKVFEDFASQIKYEYLLFDAIDKAGNPIYHTNVMMEVGTKLAIICLDVIKTKEEREKVVSKLKETGKIIVEITQEQMMNFAGNMIELKSRSGQPLMIMSQAAKDVLTPQQVETISKHSKILATDLETIETNGGGSARCMIAEIFVD